MSEPRSCDCDGWRESMEQVNAIFFHAANHRLIYTGRTFDFCPWCGERFEEPSDE